MRYISRIHFIALRKYCIFYRLKVCGNLASSKSVGASFPTAFAHFMSLCHILRILAIFQTFSLFCCNLWSLDVTIAGRLHLPEDLDDGYHFLGMKYFNRKQQYDIGVTFICTEKPNVWLTLLLNMLYCGLEPNPQYLQGMPV